MIGPGRDPGRGRRARVAPRGAALALALLWITAIALVALVLAWIGDAEGRIARNELRAARLDYAARSILEALPDWFEAPGRDELVPFPGAGVWIRDLRRADPDGRGPAPARDVAPHEHYKAGVDRDGDGRDDLLEPPYTGSILDAFQGTFAGPDLRVEDERFLETLTRRILGLSVRDASSGRLRLLRVDLLAPPFVNTPFGWRPRGIARIRVSMAIESRGRIVASRVATGVLDAIRYAGPFGPLHSCADVALGPRSPLGPSAWPFHWGPVTAQGSMDLARQLSELPPSLPRSGAGDPDGGKFWGSDFVANPAAYRDLLLVAGVSLGDPWLRVQAGGDLAGAASSQAQPEPSPWRKWSGNPPAPADVIDRSHVLQRSQVGCPGYDYPEWKSVVTSGSFGVRYFAWAGRDRFREGGAGPARTLAEWTSGQRGVFFFDTRDGAAPARDGANLTPPIRISGPADWTFDGLLYVNAVSIGFHGVRGRALRLVPPGEPFDDTDGDGEHDADEVWLDLIYPTGPGEAIRAAAVVGERAARGPEQRAMPVALRGVLYTSGRFDAAGDGVHYGSVVAAGGVLRSTPGPRLSTIFWDQSVADWPLRHRGLPRVVLRDRRVDPP